jgi:hypothetical protein
MRPIPPAIKLEIFRKYLEGYSIPEISKLYNNVSVGSIHSITKEESKNDDAFTYIREIAKKLKKDNIDIYDLIPAINLRIKIKNLGLNYEVFEDFLVAADTESFRININLDEFIKRVIEILTFEKYNNIKIHEIKPYIEKEIKRLNEVSQEKERIDYEVGKFSNNIGLTRDKIQEYFHKKPLLEEYEKNRENFSKSLGWHFYPDLFEKASNEIGIDINSDILYEKLRNIYRNPHHNTELIRMILEGY